MADRNKKRCIVVNCEGVAIARRWCNKHYRRWKKHGDPEKLVQFPTPEEAFQHRTKRVGDCLFWTGSKGNNGYGRIKVNGKLQETHRFSWERTNGPIPEDMFIDHICHNPPCVNVEHLRLATFAQNSSHLGGAKKGSKSGIRNVYWVRGKWRVRVKKNGKLYYFGYYDDLDEAAEVAQAAREKLFGEFAGKG